MKELFTATILLIISVCSPMHLETNDNSTQTRLPSSSNKSDANTNNSSEETIKDSMTEKVMRRNH